MNAVLPAGAETSMGPQEEETRAFVRGLHALKWMATPLEIAKTVLFLASDASASQPEPQCSPTLGCRSAKSDPRGSESIVRRAGTVSCDRGSTPHGKLVGGVLEKD
ncbi:MAG: hypothetical protein JKY37_02430 [Nannocystaceae bacterium]|nr:hypothetical protein [Nannocystaceae bacterium]